MGSLMITKNYLECLNLGGSTTGNFIASYNFLNQVDSVILNDIYPTGSAYFYDGVKNVFNLDKSNLFLFKDGSPFSGPFSGNFSGNHYASIKTSENLNSFDFIIDFSLNECANTKPLVLLSTFTGSSLSSGFLIGINQCNKLFVERGVGTGKKIDTLELGVTLNNSINFKFSESSLNIERYNYLNKSVTNNSIDLSEAIKSNDLILGKSFGPYSGFSGLINQMFLIRSSGSNAQNGLIGNYHECLFCSGVNLSTGSGFFVTNSFANVLSIGTSGVTITGVTGYQNVSYYDSGAGQYLSKISGLTGSYSDGFVITGELIKSTGYYPSGIDSAIFDEARRYEYLVGSTIKFINSLESGDLLEVYDYVEENKKIDLLAKSYSSGDEVLFSNGMLLIRGLDYGTGSFGEITGSFDASDEVRLNTIERPVSYLIYSGLYDSYKQITGMGIDTGYYPDQSQFYESGDGNVTITGLGKLFYSGFSLTGHDLFMNGQKIYTGINYSTGVYGGEESLIIHAGEFDNAELSITTDLNGALVSVDRATESILAFCPRQKSKFTTSINFLNSNLSSYVVTGQSSEVWVNGMRMTIGVDFDRVPECSSYSFAFKIDDLPYIFCKNDDNFFNIT